MKVIKPKKIQKFSTGAVRDARENKPRPDLISPFILKRLGYLMIHGGKKYGIFNWEKGMPLSRFWESAMRHTVKFAMNPDDKEEDNLSAIIFNVGAIIHFQETGRKDLDDLHRYKINCKMKKC